MEIEWIFLVLSKIFSPCKFRLGKNVRLQVREYSSHSTPDIIVCRHCIVVTVCSLCIMITFLFMGYRSVISLKTLSLEKVKNASLEEVSRKSNFGNKSVYEL